MKIVRYNNIQHFSTITNRMENRITEKNLNEIWLWESYPIYTVGSGIENNNDNHLSVSRGGDITYHCPGQRIIYFLIHLKISYKEFIERANIACCNALKELKIDSYFQWNPLGIWIDNKNKIASSGFRIKNQTIYHGIAINILNDTKEFNRINPCGLKDIKIKSCIEINKDISINAFDSYFIKYFTSMHYLN